MPVPYVIYADFESIIKPHTENAGDKSEIKTKHEACGFGYQIVRYDGQIQKPVIYRGENAAEKFLKSLKRAQYLINQVFSKPKPLQMTEQNEKDFQSATKCWVCEGTQFDNGKVRDHCHITGEYRGAAHTNCNLKLAIKPYKTPIPILFHNLKGYDSHLHHAKNSKSNRQY